MSVSTWARVRCGCGQWREINSHDGHVVETCACGYRQSLRGNPPAEAAVEYVPIAYSNYPLCVWPGCDRRVTGNRTDMCSTHCDERRRLKHRAEAKERMRRNRAVA